MKFTSDTGRYIGFRNTDAHEFLVEIQQAKNMRLLNLTLKGDDTYDALTFDPKKSEYYLAQFDTQQ